MIIQFKKSDSNLELDWRCTPPIDMANPLQHQTSQMAQAKIVSLESELEWAKAELASCQTLLAEELLRSNKLETNLNHCEVKLERVQRVARIGIFECDLKAHKATWSRQLFHIFGLDPSQPEPSPEELMTYVYPDDRLLWHSSIQDAIATGNPMVFEFRIQRPDGEIRYAEVKGELISSEISSEYGESDNRTVHLFGTVLDVTDRNQIEESFRLSQFCLDHTADSIVWITPEANISYANNAACRMMGFSREEILNRTVFDNNPNFTPEIWAAHWQELKRMGSQMFENKLRTHDGKLISVEISANYVKFNGKEYNCSITRDISIHVDAELALRASEARYRLLFNSINDAVFAYTIDSNGNPTKFIEVNDVACRELGYSREELLQLTPNHITAPGYTPIPSVQADLSDQSDQSVDQQQSVFEVVHVAKNGRRFPVEISARMLELNDEVTVIGIARNISDRLTAESSLRESEERFRATFEQAAVGISHIDLDGRFVWLNQKFCDIVGYSHVEMQMMTLEDIVHPEDLAECLATLLRLQSGEISTCSLEERYLHQANSIIWVNFSVSLVWGGSGSPKYFVAVVTDISDRKAADEALRERETQLCESREKYKALFDSLPIGISITDDLGNIIEANPASENILGISLAEHTNRAIADLSWQVLRPDGSPMPSLEYAAVRALSEQKNIENLEMGVVKPNGEVIWLRVTAAPIPLPRYGVAIAYIDFTRRKQAQDALQQQTERERLIGAISNRIGAFLRLDDILTTTVEEVRQFLQADRVFIYRFNPEIDNRHAASDEDRDFSINDGGEIAAESVECGYRSISNMSLGELWLGETQDSCHSGYIHIIHDLDQTELPPDSIEFVHRHHIRASLAVPISIDSVGSKDDHPLLWGVLIANQCASTRYWQPLEVNLLNSLAIQLAIAIQQAQLFEQVEAANQKLQSIAYLDFLTQVPNRRRFDEHLYSEWNRLAREMKPLSLIMCDIDFFKFFNDAYGHLTGDECLQQVARAIEQAVSRPADLVSRFGGEEFVVILPNTSIEGSIKVAQKIQESIKALQIIHEYSSVSHYITLSLGVASMVPIAKAPNILVSMADQALYQAKENGRDCIYSIG
jgi:diguanylate cyclase (GGDEF)-like protein/PAS domain S-box-containing protein